MVRLDARRVVVAVRHRVPHVIRVDDGAVLVCRAGSLLPQDYRRNDGRS